MNFDTFALVTWLFVFSLVYRKFRDPRVYILTNLLGAWLFLPESVLALPLLPDLSKYTVFSLSALIATRFFGRKSKFKLRIWDWPILMYCTIPIFSSLENDLGLWDGVSASIKTYLQWCVPYFLARQYFRTIADLKFILLGTVVAAVVYLPFMWLEVYMSPLLHQSIYGFTQADMVQHIRYGGWRPKVFMQHGLMVALFLSISVLAIFTLRITDKTTRIMKVRSSIVEKILMITAVFACKSGNGFIILAMAILARLMTKAGMARLMLLALIFIIAGYLTVRVSGYWDGIELINKIESISGDAQRAGSMGARIRQENLFLLRAEEKWLFGWGGWGRAFPIDEYGNRLTRGVDSLWIIVYSHNGVIALTLFFWMFLAAPYVVATRAHKMALNTNERSFVYMVSFIPVFVMVDSLANSMLSPLYTMVVGSLTSVIIDVQSRHPR